MGHDILDSLAMLTGVCPAASTEDRLQRLRWAAKWMASKDLVKQYPNVRDYIFAEMKRSES